MTDITVQRIVSGGQTGVDRGGLDAALALGIEQGGWCPRGRRAEDGKIPGHYRLRETEAYEYHVRTEQNVIDSDGTLILYRDKVTGGTKFTYRMARKHNRPCLLVDLTEQLDVEAVRQWLRAAAIRVLNIAGPRESSHPGIMLAARDAVVQIISGAQQRRAD